MADIAVGKDIRSWDFPPTQFVTDDTPQLNLTNTSYVVGSPEVGIYFLGPNSGRVRMTVGGGLRDSAGTDRVFLSPQIFENDSNGTVFMSTTIDNGYGSDESSTQFQYASRSILVENLTPNQVYYARLLYAIGGLAPVDTADLAARDIIIMPVP